jgi:hypothetical protein
VPEKSGGSEINGEVKDFQRWRPRRRRM